MEAAGAARAVDQFVAQHGQRVFDLERLDRQVRGIGHVDMHAIKGHGFARQERPRDVDRLAHGDRRPAAVDPIVAETSARAEAERHAAA